MTNNQYHLGLIEDCKNIELVWSKSINLIKNALTSPWDMDFFFVESWRYSILGFFESLIDVGIRFIAVPLMSISSKPLRFLKFSGNSSIFEQPNKVRIFRDIKQAFRRLERFLQSLRSNSIRPVTCSATNGRYFIGVLFK